MKKVLKIVAIAFVAFGFVACDKVGEAVDSVSKATKSSDSGDSSAKETANSSVKVNGDGYVVKAIASDSICKISTDISAYSYAPDYESAIDSIAKYSEVGDKQYWANKLIRYYGGEIKKSDKETICLAVPMVVTDYLKIDLTPQEIERFERFLIEKEADYYRNYEMNKADYLNALKFLKHYNKLDEWYSVNSKKDSVFGKLEGLANNIHSITSANREPITMAKKFVYGKDTGAALQVYHDVERPLYQVREISGSCFEEESHTNHKECQATIKWIKSIQKQYIKDTK